MAWSTRQLAELTGVTTRAIRHWHEVGILPLPERLSNGYKQYSVRHLVVALRINRLTGLGFGLAEIGRLLTTERADGSLVELRAEVHRKIVQLQALRAELDELIASGTAPDLSAAALQTWNAFGDDAASRGMAIILAHFMPAEDTAALAAILGSVPPQIMAINEELMALAGDADTAEIEELATRAAALTQAFWDSHGREFPAFPEHVLGGNSLTELVADGLNPAQRLVLARLLDQLT